MQHPSYTPPADIDGTPAEVARAAAGQLADWIEHVDRIAELTAVQVRNAAMSRVLDQEPLTPPSELSARVPDDHDVARLHKLRGALRVAFQRAEEIAGRTV